MGVPSKSEEEQFLSNSIKWLSIPTLNLFIYIYTQKRLTFERQNAVNSYLNDTHMLHNYYISEKILVNKKLFQEEQRKQGTKEMLSS